MGNLNNISGVFITPLKLIKNPLGDIYHGFKKSDVGYINFKEAYFSSIKYESIKPWKKHKKMTLNLIVPVGKIRFVLFDDRDNVETKGNFIDISLSLENYYRLTVPPGICMAFKGESKGLNLLLNIADYYHDPNEIIRLDLNAIDYNW